MKQVFPMDSRVTYDAEGRPSYDRAVSSKPLRSLIRKLFTTGVMPNPSDTCQVRAGGDGMTLIVSPGLAVLEGGLYLEDAARTLSVTAADTTFDRIDTVVLRWNENDAVRDCDLHVVAGVPAKNPVRPALNREGSIYEIGLADIFVTKGVATITNEKITDTRMESARCGIVSSVSEFDTTTIYQQIQGELAKFKSDEEVAFAEWFDYMKDQLTEDAAGRLQQEVDEINLLKADKTALAETNTNLANTNGNISILEDTTTATRNYAVGEFVTVKTEGKLRKVTSAIASGGMISNSNTEITTAGAEFRQISADLISETSSIRDVVNDTLKLKWQAPIFVSSTSEMTDKTAIYVLTSNSHVYSYNGNNFTDTGIIYGVSDNYFMPNVIIGANNYEVLGITSLTDLEPNKIYGIGTTLTSEMVSGLPFYGVNYTITTFQPTFSTGGFTLYMAVYGSANITRTLICFEYSNGLVSPWNEYRSDNALFDSKVIVNSSNYEDIGYSSVKDFPHNGIYGIDYDITSEMISGLPLYGESGTLTVEKPKNQNSSGFTKYEYVAGTSANILKFTAFSYGNGNITPWFGQGNKNYVTCGFGGNFDKIQDAVDWVNDGGTVKLLAGTFEEQVSVTNKTVHIVGSGKGVTILKDTSGDYRTPPLEIGSGSVQNMTIIETGDGIVEDTRYNKTAYCIHADWEIQEGASLLLKDLDLINNCHACIGIGARKDFDLTIENCSMNTTDELSEHSSRGTLYAHTFAGTESGTANINLYNNIIKSGSDIALTLQRVTNQNVKMNCSIINNSLVANGSTDNNIFDGGNGTEGTFDASIIKNAISNGNNLPVLNAK